MPCTGSGLNQKKNRKHKNINMKKVVDLSNSNIIEKGDEAAELLCGSNPSRFRMPEDILLTVDMDNDAVQAIKDAIRFNSAIELPDTPTVVSKPTIEDKPVKQKHESTLIPKEVDTVSEAQEESIFDGMKIGELRAYALEKEIDISGIRKKEEIVKVLSEQ
jgi:hypothetical protein